MKPMPVEIEGLLKAGAIELRKDGTVWKLLRRTHDGFLKMIPRRIDKPCPLGGRRIVIREGDRIISCSIKRIKSACSPFV